MSESKSITIKNLITYLPKIIDQNNFIYSKINNKIKSNSVFNNIEVKNYNNLKKFINLSYSRNNEMKIGQNLSDIIKNNNKKIIDISNSILNDSFYKNHLKTYNLEKKKLTKNFSEPFLKKSKILLTKLQNKSNRYKNIQSKVNKYIKYEKNNNIILKNKKEIFEKNKEFIENSFDDEKNKINNSINLYLTQMNDFIEKYNNHELDKKDLKQINDEQIKNIINYNKIKLLNFESKKIHLDRLKKIFLRKKLLKDEANLKLKVNYRKLIAYSGNKKSFNKSKSSKNIINKNNLNVLYSNKSFCYNKNQTVNLLLNQITNNNSEKNLLNKLKNINLIIKNNIPNFEDYHKLIKLKLIEKQKIKNKVYKNILKNNILEYDDSYNNLEEYNNKNILNENKNLNNTKIQIKEKIKKFIENFLLNQYYLNKNNIKQNKSSEVKKYNIPIRNKFIDEYSIKNNFNNDIENINKKIGKNIFNKILFQNTIEKYLYDENYKKYLENDKYKNIINIYRNREKNLNYNQKKIIKNIQKTNDSNLNVDSKSTISTERREIILDNNSSKINKNYSNEKLKYSRNKMFNNIYILNSMKNKAIKYKYDFFEDKKQEENEYYYNEFKEHQKSIINKEKMTY